MPASHTATPEMMLWVLQAPVHGLSCEGILTSVRSGTQFDSPFSQYCLRSLTGTAVLTTQTFVSFLSLQLVVGQKFSVRSDLFICLHYHLSSLTSITILRA